MRTWFLSIEDGNHKAIVKAFKAIGCKAVHKERPRPKAGQTWIFSTNGWIYHTDSDMLMSLARAISNQQPVRLVDVRHPAEVSGASIEHQVEYRGYIIKDGTRSDWRTEEMKPFKKKVKVPKAGLEDGELQTRADTFLMEKGLAVFEANATPMVGGFILEIPPGWQAKTTFMSLGSQGPGLSFKGKLANFELKSEEADKLRWALSRREHVEPMDAPNLQRWTSRIAKRHQLTEPIDRDHKNYNSFLADWLQFTQSERAAAPSRGIARYKLVVSQPWILGEREVEVLKRLEDICPELANLSEGDVVTPTAAPETTKKK